MIEKIDTQRSTYSGKMIIDKINEIIDFLNNTYLMRVKDGNVISDDNTMLSLTSEGLNIPEATFHEYNASGVKCPHCGASHYLEMYHTVTAVNYPTIYKDGEYVNSGHNTQTTRCQCLECGKEFTIND